MVSCLTYYSLVLLVLTTFFVSSTSNLVSNLTSPNNPKRLVLKLIHRFSIASPFYNSNNTLTNYLNESYGYPQLYLQPRLFQKDDLDPPSLFLVNFSIGEPPIPQYAFMDTGSNILWVKCNQRKSPQQYDPGKSSTYKAIPCFSPKCIKSSDIFCDEDERCRFIKRYKDDSYSAGVLAFEKLTFRTGDDGIAFINKVVFGCSLENRRYLTKPWKGKGVFGLGARYPSILDNLKQTGFPKFSYCFGSVDDTYYAYNQLILGEGADMLGDKIPLHILGSHYHVSVIGISVGRKMLDISPEVLVYREGDAESGVIIDSGTMDIVLVYTVYKVLRKEIESLLDPLLPKIESNNTKDPRLCYKGRISEDLKDFPIVKFHFVGGAELSLDPQNFFYASSVFSFCMDVLSPAYFQGSIIGVRAQQFHNVGFDLQAQTLSLQRIECELLAED